MKAVLYARKSPILGSKIDGLPWIIVTLPGK
jgi:hypothetical protein